MWYIVRLDSSRVATLVKVRSGTLVSGGDPTRVKSNYIPVYTTIIRQIESCHGVSKSTTFLGICLDENLTWKHHIANVNSKISRALFSIKQVKNILPVSMLNKLYLALIHSHSIYGILSWGNAGKSTLQKTVTLKK